MRRFSLFTLALTVLVGTASVHSGDSGSRPLCIGSPAEALLFKKAFRKVKRGIRGAVRRVRGAARKVGKGIKKGAKTVGKGIKKGAKTIGKGIKKGAKGVGKLAKKGFKTVKKVGKKVVDGVKKVAGKVMGALGLPLLQKLAKPALSFLLKKGCGGIVDLIAKKTGISGLVKKLGGALSFAGKCATEFVKGFICSIPNVILDAANLIKDVVQTTWKKKSVCLPMALVAGIGPQSLVTPLACGTGFYVVEKIKKAISCIGNLTKMGGGELGRVLKSLAMQGCNMAGDLAFDLASGIVLSIASAGSGIPVVIAKVLMKAMKVIKMADNVMSVVGKLNSMGSCK